MPTGRTSFTASNIQDGFGNKLAAGTLSILPTDDSDNPITATSGESGGGAIAVVPACVAVTTGAIPGGLTVADTRDTLPPNICYRVTVKNAAGVPVYVLPLVQSPQDGSAIDLDTYSPQLPQQTQVVGPAGAAGPAGATGPAGPPVNARGPFVGTNIYSPGDLVTFTDGLSYVNRVATGTGGGGGLTPVAGNIFDKTAITANSVISSDTGAVVSSFSGYSCSDYLFVQGASNFVSNIPIGLFDPTPAYGVAFYDSSKTFLAGSGITGSGTTSTEAVPSGAYWVRIWWNDGTLSSGVGIAAAIVNVGTVLLSSYAAYNGGPVTGGDAVAPPDGTHWQPISVAPSVSPWNGKYLGVFGDSITAFNVWQQGVAAAHGMTLSLNSGQAGYHTGQIFDQYLEAGQASGGTVDMVALGAALAGIDLLIIEFGTNDGYFINQTFSQTLGTFADDATVNSFYGHLQRALTTLFTLRPTGMTVIWLAPYHTQRLAGQTLPSGDYDTHYTDAFLAGSLIPAIEAVCAEYAVPVLDQSRNGMNMYNFANPDGSALVLRDHLHPSTLGFDSYMIPFVSRGIARFAKVP